MIKYIFCFIFFLLLCMWTVLQVRRTEGLLIQKDSIFCSLHLALKHHALVLKVCVTASEIILDTKFSKYGSINPDKVGDKTKS